MDDQHKKEVLLKAQDWFRDTISKNHIKNTKKLSNPDAFHINPFLTVYLANFLTGDASPESIAKALIYPRVLGTSITTSFGQNMQSFASKVLSSFGSTTRGIDIEFDDAVDGLKKYCQLKAGPNTINKDDVETISNHFKSIKNLARTNNLNLGYNNLIVGVLYGHENDLSSHYKSITQKYDYPVLIGQDFWTRLTGDPSFYHDLIKSIGIIAKEANFTHELEEVIAHLAGTLEIQDLAKEISG